MKVLLANDDGIFSPGLKILYETLNELAECTVVAPDRDCSGSSSSLTLSAPLRTTKLENGFISVNGSPADCVHLALNGLLHNAPDIVICGINLGSNLGDDVLYSGTVGAALQGRFLSQPAIAISLCSKETHNLVSAASICVQLFKNLQYLKLTPGTLLNVNVPDLPLDQIKGFKLTRFGHRKRPLPIQPSEDPRGHKGFWIAAVGQPEDNDETTDFHAVYEGYTSVTPLKIDQTNYEVFDEVQDWLGQQL